MENENNVQYVTPQVSMTSPVLSVGQWILTLIILAIPCVGFIMTIVWAFGTGDQGRKNFCRATLLLAIICIVISVALLMLTGGLAAVTNNLYN